MKRRILKFAIVALSLGMTASSLMARGGGGCLEQGTPIMTPSGPVPVEQLTPGDTVLGVECDFVMEATVMDVIQVQPDYFYELSATGHVLRLTGEHPIEIAPGVFREASYLEQGDGICIRDQEAIHIAKIESYKRIQTGMPAYNLLVSPCGTYLANGVVVHNKGCFLPDTLVRNADGSEIPISTVKPGDSLLAFTPEDGLVHATVRRVLAHEVDEYLEVSISGMLLRVTPEHPFYVGQGTFKTIEALNTGDTVFVLDGNALSPRMIERIETVHAKTMVFNLQTDKPNTFFANGVAVHNKGGGCFPAGTLILTPDGKTPIEDLVPGDIVTAVDKNGRPVSSRVRETHTTRSYLLEVTTTQGSLITTAEHPLMLSGCSSRTAGELQQGEEVLVWDGIKAQTATVAVVTDLEVVRDVYNLTVEWPHTFVANDFVVHNKGGGGFHGSSFHSSHGGGGTGGEPLPVPVVLGMIAFAVVAVVISIVNKQRSDEKDNLDFVYSPSQVAAKSAKTLKLLQFLAKQDTSVTPDTLSKQAGSTFLKLQACWQTRDYTPMQPLMMPDLYAEHRIEIAGMVRNHEINMIDQLRIDRIDLVNIRYTFKENQREFTALMTATARDYYIDDRTRSWLRGDEEPAQFQEFWTFQFHEKAWLLREIEQTKESKILKDDNFFEQFTDTGVNQIYGRSADKEGPTGPSLEKEADTKETRVERLLNFLVQTDKLWNREAMLETVRSIFLQVEAARESGDPATIPTGILFPGLAASLSAELKKNQDKGITMEFRNLCVRKVELMLVRNYADNSKDEFFVRIRAHAQTIVTQNTVALQRDADVTPFEQYMTFGRLDNQWKLKELLLPADAAALASQDNIDEGSSAQQMDWYYQHNRAT